MYQATEEDKILARKVISEEYHKNDMKISEKELDEKVKDILNISYSIGGGYDENTLRKIVRSLIERNC